MQQMIQSTVATSATQMDRPIRVFMMDLLSIVPYYTGHLCAALRDVEELRIDIGAITYHLDPDFFQRKKLQTNPGALDLISNIKIGSPMVRRVLKTGEWLINMAALALRFTIAKPDVIHVQFLPMLKLGVPLELWLLKLARKRGISVVYTVHNVLPHDSGPEQRATYESIYALADRLICHDICASDRLVKEFNVDARKISIIPHGPLFDQPTSRKAGTARTKLGLSPNQTLVLWQGILRPYKGVSFLLKAWQKVMKKLKEQQAVLAVVGNGEEQLLEEVREEVKSLDLASSVKLDLRFISIDEMTDLYLDASILVYPYSDVTTSGALMTGIGYGKAIVATRLPAFEQLLQDGENALLVPYDDTDALAASLLRLINDKSLTARLGERAKDSHQNGSQWAGIAAQTLACYQSAIAPVEHFKS